MRVFYLEYAEGRSDWWVEADEITGKCVLKLPSGESANQDYTLWDILSEMQAVKSPWREQASAVQCLWDGEAVW